MIGSFLDNIFEKAQNDSFFDDLELIKAYEYKTADYPIKSACITFCASDSDSDIALTGSGDYAVFSESISVTVASDERRGADFCRQTARDVCLEIMKLDTDKSIISVSTEGCEYDKNILGYRITINFGLGESCIYLGGD